MDGREFFSRVQGHQELEWLGCREGQTPADDEVLVQYRRTGAKFALSVRAVRDHSWDELEGVLAGTRQPRVLTHVTRIVGYFSQLQNWNRSKIAELNDRHRGAYSLPDKGKAPAAKPVPAVAKHFSAAVA
jgi:hypothetical protein